MNNRPLYFIREYAEDYFFHGGIGIIDAERILENQGFCAIRLPHHFDFSLRSKVSRFLFCTKQLFTIPHNAVVVFIHPLHAKLNRWLISQLRKKKVTVICMIGDINGLKDGNSEVLDAEIRLFKHFNFFVVHNEGMLTWLNATVPGRKASMIEFFDFLAPPGKGSQKINKKIVFAGNLDKSRFLKDLHQIPLQFELYGPGITTEILDQANVQYHGVFDPYELPQKLEGSYGLVWDGDSVYGMKGSLGNYMQYISHHKLSLYILAGLPIITSCSAASAPLIAKYKIGFCVNSLLEITDIINAVTLEQYRIMVNNMAPLANRVAEGKCLSTAINKLIEEAVNS